MKILDCTLRDGGYQTNWNFDLKLVNEYLRFCIRHDISIIELGYKSLKKDRGFWGVCDDNLVSSVLEEIPDNLAFMIDFFEYKEDTNLLKNNLKEEKNSPFSYCRLAIKPDEVYHKNFKKTYQILKKLGYKVFINLMDSINCDEKTMSYFLSQTNKLDLEGIYFADSYGELNFKNIKKLLNIKSKNNLGFHGHDNLGLALSNSLILHDNGYSFIDSTVSGLGRGSGNVKTEQLLIHVYENEFDYTIFDTVNKFKKICKETNCGDSIEYGFSGKKSIHPLYIQRCINSNLSSERFFDSVKNKTSSYDESFIEEKSAVVIPARYKSTRFEGKPLAKIRDKEMVIRVCERSSKAVGKENVFVATDDENIKNKVESFGYNVLMTNSNLVTGTDRIAEASAQLKNYDIIVNVQGDEPFIDPKDIRLVINEKQKNPDCVINCYSKISKQESSSCKNIPKVAISNHNLIYISRSPIPSGKDCDLSKYKQVGLYAFNHKDLEVFNNKKTPIEEKEDIEILRFLENNIPVKMVETFSKTISVDTKEDLRKVEDFLISKDK